VLLLLTRGAGKQRCALVRRQPRDKVPHHVVHRERRRAAAVAIVADRIGGGVQYACLHGLGGIRGAQQSRALVVQLLAVRAAAIAHIAQALELAASGRLVVETKRRTWQARR
jgi:predicted dinucleotide-binding enzyme